VADRLGHTTVGPQLDVMIADHPRFQVTNLYAVPNAKLGAATVGMMVPIKADLATPGEGELLFAHGAALPGRVDCGSSVTARIKPPRRE
jgi:hypothetical protein